MRSTGRLFLRGLLPAEHAALTHSFNPNMMNLYNGAQILYKTSFESFDNFIVNKTGTGTITYDGAAVILSTGTTSGSAVEIFKNYDYPINEMSWSKVRRIRSKVRIGTNTSQEIHILSGDLYNYRHIGFQVVNNLLYGTVADGSTEATLLLETLIGSAIRLLEAVLTPGVECRFYVDGVDKGAITTNLPTGTLNAYNVILLYILNSEAADKTLALSEWVFLQEP